MADKKQTSLDTSVIFIGTFVATVIGMLRESITANYFGLGSKSDALFAAMVFPTMLFTMLLSSFSGMFINVYKEYLSANGVDNKNQFLSSYIPTYTIWTLILTIIFTLPAKHILNMVASIEPVYVKVAIRIFSIFMVVAFFRSVINLFISLFQAERRFRTISTGNIIISVVMIITIVPLIKRFDIYGVALSMLSGHLLCFLYFVIEWLRQYPFTFNGFILFDVYIKRTITLGLPMLLLSMFNQLNFVIDQKMASIIEPGGLSSLYFAFKLVSVPHALISLSIGAVFYPLWVEKNLDKSKEYLRVYFIRSLKGAVIILWPAAFGMFILRNIIISSIFQHGIFGVHEVASCTGVFGAYVLGLFMVPVNSISIGLIKSLTRMRLLVSLGMLTVIMNIIGNLIFMRIWGVKGIAFATTMINLMFPFICLPFIRKFIGKMFMKEDINFFMRIIVNTIVMGFLVYLFSDYLHIGNRYIELSILVMTGVTIYGMLSYKQFLLIKS